MTRQRRTRYPAIPERGEEAVQALKTAMEQGTGRRGQRIDRWVTFRDLADTGLFEVGFRGDGSAVMRPNPGGDWTGPFEPDRDGGLDFGVDDLTKPPRPTGVRARGLNLNTIGLSWNAPNYSNHHYAEIFAAKVDGWSNIEQTFNTGKPIGAGNTSQYFMGTASGVTFMHRNLGGTVPVANFERGVSAITHQTGGDVFSVVFSESAAGLFAQGDEFYLTASGDWSGNGREGTVVGVVGDTEILARFHGGIESIPQGIEVVLSKKPTEDDLEAALNPDVIYYWVRFVSTAGIPGDVQSEEGAPGTVMLNPEEILNILTGRIRSSQLANDIVTPINFIRGPITELDDEGNRRWGTVREFVEALGDDAISSYDETLEEVLLGYLAGGDGFSIEPIIRYQSLVTLGNNFPRFEIILPEFRDWMVGGNFIQVNAAPGTFLHPLAPVPGEEPPKFRITTSVSHALGRRIIVEIEQPGFNRPESAQITIDDATASPEGTEVTDRPGLAAAAAFVRRVTGETSGEGAYIQSLETLQAGIEDDAGNLLNLEGVRSIIGTIQQKALVRLGLEDAAVEIRDNLQFEIGIIDPDTGNPYGLVAANEAANIIFANENSITQSITFKVQQNIGGVLFSAGFGIGLESEPGGVPTSTFAVAADQFAIMGAANHGRVAVSGQTASSANRTYTIVCAQGDGGDPVQDGLSVGTLVAITVPSQGNQTVIDAFRGKTFEITNRVDFTFTVQQIGDEPYVSLGSTQFTGNNAGVAMFPEQSVPFIVNTTVNPPVVGIRGRLIVDGMITAREIEVTELLRANEIWSVGITNFGLIQTKAAVGEVLGTPRIGGWAVRIATADPETTQRPIEFSRWSNDRNQLIFPSDPKLDPEDPNDQDFILNPDHHYPHFRPDHEAFRKDTAFYIESTGHGGSVNCYVRGNLTVGGNARIWTGYEINHPAHHFVQMDNVFPLFIMKRSDALAAGIPIDSEGGMTYSDGIRSAIRRDALFWVEARGDASRGIAGFNTANEAIFIDQTPMDPPSGGGFIHVKSALDQNGNITGRGRVWMSAEFQMSHNRASDRNLMYTTFALFLVPSTFTPPWSDGAGFFRPSQRGSPSIPVITGGGWPAQGQPVITPSYSPQISQFMDQHFLIIRNPTQTTNDAYNIYSTWKNTLVNTQGGYFVAEHTNMEWQGIKRIQGFAEAVSSANYKALVVIVERLARRGDVVYGNRAYIATSGGDENSKTAGVPHGASILSQQVSNTQHPGAPNEVPPVPAFEALPPPVEE